MYIKNQSGRIVDVNEDMELTMSYMQDIEIISVSSNFWRNFPQRVAEIKERNPRLVIDGSTGIETNLAPSPKPVSKKINSIGKRSVTVPKGKIHFVIYPNYLPKVGGIETAVYELANALDKNKYCVTIAFYSYESEESMKRYSNVANLVQLDGQEISCDICLITSNHLQPIEIKAKKWIQWVHSDYEKYNNLQLVDNPDVTDYVAVSKHVAKVCKRMFGIDCHVIYNLLDPKFGKNIEKPIRFVSNTRLSPEKGFNPKTDRMLKFARLLKASGKNFIWTICGDNTHMKQEEQNIIERFKEIEQVHFVGYKSNVSTTLADADYLVQLSDFEGCPYAVLEALQMGVPCIVSNWKGVEELVEEGKNGYIIRQDVKNVDINKILTEIPKGFDTTPKSSIKDWDKLFNKLHV